MRTKRPFMDGVPREVVAYIKVLEARIKAMEYRDRLYAEVVKHARAGFKHGWVNHAPKLMAAIEELDDD